MEVGRIKRIGVVSDTHNNLANTARIVELFNTAGVDRVVHTGDISQPKRSCASTNGPGENFLKKTTYPWLANTTRMSFERWQRSAGGSR